MTKIFFNTILLTIIVLTTSAQEKKETLKISWPEQYNWKIVSDRTDGPLHITDLIPGNEEAGKWSIMAAMKSDTDSKFVPMEIVMNNIFNQAKKKSTRAMVTLIERDKDARNHWIIFKVESVISGTDKGLESKLFYIIQGDHALYTNSVSIKEKSLPDDFVEKWENIFKKSELQYNTNSDTPFRTGALVQ